MISIHRLWRTLSYFRITWLGLGDLLDAVVENFGEEEEDPYDDDTIVYQL